MKFNIYSVIINAGKRLLRYDRFSIAQIPQKVKSDIRRKDAFLVKAILIMMNLYVNASAVPGGDGSLSRPFSDIASAQNLIRVLHTEQSLPAEGITVHIAPGEYPLAQGLKFGPEDSGTADCPITYCGDDAAHVLLTGGVKLRCEDFKPLSDDEAARLYDPAAASHIRKIDLTPYGITKEAIGRIYSAGSHILSYRYDNGEGDGEAELFFGGKRMTPARYPNEGYLRVAGVKDEGGHNEPGRNPRGGTFIYDDETAKHVRTWAPSEDLWTFGYYRAEWADSSIRIKNLDIANNALTLEQACIYGIKEGARYHFFNVFEELDMPGEYYLDRNTCTLYFYAPADPASEDTVLTITTESLLDIAGASYLTFRNLSVAYTRGDGITVNGGFDTYGTWSNRMRPRRDIGTADGSHITIDTCRVFAVRQAGISAHGTDLTVRGCEVFNIGTNGIYVSGGDRNTLAKSGNLITDNLIHDWSQAVFTYCGAIGLQGCGHVVSHNDMHHCTHFAVLYLGNDHIIEYNHIHHVCLDTDDCGAIYSGRSYSDRGTIIRYNYIHDVGRPHNELGIGTIAEGIYFDDLMSGQTVIGNILENITGFALQFGGGRDYVCENNIIINSRIAIQHCARGYHGVFSNGWYGNLFADPNNTEFVRLHMVPYLDEIWASAYPELARTKFTIEGVEEDDPDLCVNPSNSIIRRNVSYPGKLFDCALEIDGRARQFSHIEDPVRLETLETDFPGAASGDYTMAENAAILTALPAFEAIPFAKIGRFKA